MPGIYVVERKPRINTEVQGKRPGEELDPLPLGRMCFRVVDTRTGDHVGDPYDDEETAHNECLRLNELHAQ
jgi:hypothetical protein